MLQLVESVLFKLSYVEIYFLVLVYFLFLYFAVGYLFDKTCQILAKKALLNKILLSEPDQKQYSFEIKHSLISIIIFGFSGIPVVYLIREGYVEVLPDSILNILIGVTILTLWNEVHFFVVHRIMHLPFMMRRFHWIHHRSVIPTVYSVYSFHWLEALLLSTVPLSIMPFIHFAPMAIFLYPTISILLNFSGHCNYRFGNGDGNRWQIFATKHNEHHSKGLKNYGFATFFLDMISAKLFSKK
jgi:lathosterol oxidase